MTCLLDESKMEIEDEARSVKGGMDFVIDKIMALYNDPEKIDSIAELKSNIDGLRDCRTNINAGVTSLKHMDDNLTRVIVKTNTYANNLKMDVDANAIEALKHNACEIEEVLDTVEENIVALAERLNDGRLSDLEVGLNELCQKADKIDEVTTLMRRRAFTLSRLTHIKLLHRKQYEDANDK